MRHSTLRAPWPRTEELAFEPELAPLALLEAAFAITVQALIARNPELLAPDSLARPPPLGLSANRDTEDRPITGEDLTRRPSQL